MLELNGTPGLSRRWRWAIAIAAAAVIPMQLVARTPAPQETAIWQKSSKSIVFETARPAEKVVYVAELDEATGKVATLRELDRKAVVVEKSGPSFDLYTLVKTFLFAKESQNAQVAVEQAQRKLAAARAEKDYSTEKRLAEKLAAGAQLNETEKRLAEKLVKAEAQLNAARAQAEQARAAAQARDVEKQDFTEKRVAEKLAQAEAQLNAARAQAEQARAVEQQTDKQLLAEMLAKVQKQEKERPNDEALREQRKLYFEKAVEQKVTIESEQLRRLAEQYQRLAAEARRLADEFERLQRQAVQPK